MNERVIWKITLNMTDVQSIEVPIGSKFLYVGANEDGEQFDHINVWFLCDPSSPKEKRIVTIRGTGHPASSDDGDYIGTAVMLGGKLVFHVFVKPRQEL